MNGRYAVVGAGWISQIAFLPGIELTGNSTATALVSGSAKNAAKLAVPLDADAAVGANWAEAHD